MWANPILKGEAAVDRARAIGVRLAAAELHAARALGGRAADAAA
jgi:hypothetical protein